MDNLLFPWQTTVWQQLLDVYQAERLAHGLLFSGIRGIAKTHFTKQLAAFLLCDDEHKREAACGECHSCRLLLANTHPDFIDITPQELGKAIKVDQIRELLPQLSKTSTVSKTRLVMIHPADAMNRSAANALLKSLEEPRRDTYLLLITEHLMQVPPTVRSRCQCISIKAPTEADALSWMQVDESIRSFTEEEQRLALRLAQGGPLLADDYLNSEQKEERKTVINGLHGLVKGENDPVSLAKSWAKIPLTRIVLTLQSYVMDILRLQSGATEAYLDNFDYDKAILYLAKRQKSIIIYQYLQECYALQRLALSPVTLNQNLQIEAILISWHKLFVR